MSKTVLKGKNLMVSIDGTVYGFATSCDINIDVDTKEISAGSYKHVDVSGQWKEFETERKGWTVNTEHLASSDMGDCMALYDILSEGTAVDITYTVVTATGGQTGDITPSTTLGWKGKAIVNSLKVSAQNDNDATFSISLQGTGALAKLA